MAELTPKERLQPSLLDRLRDDEPRKLKETSQQRVLSLRQLREAVLRDLTSLFNAGNLTSIQPLDDFPLVSHSVLNYGFPELAGKTVSDLDAFELERMLRQVICDYEPRILRNTLKVKAVVSEDQMTHNAITFEIEGALWAQPAPEYLFLRTEIDLENGEAIIAEI